MYDQCHQGGLLGERHTSPLSYMTEQAARKYEKVLLAWGVKVSVIRVQMHVKVLYRTIHCSLGIIERNDCYIGGLW